MVKTVFAIMVSLLIAGSAYAGSTSDEAAPRGPAPGVVRLFGTTLCLSNAPMDAQCDWRFPDSQATREDLAARRRALTLFGKRFCAADAAGPCDVRFPAAPTRPSKTVHLFGLTWCFGDATAGSKCDLTLPSVPPPDETTARL